MRGTTSWDYRPYTRLSEIRKRELPYVCRLAPGKDFVEVQWLDNGGDGPHEVCARLRANDKPEVIAKSDNGYVKMEGLLPDREYEVYVRRAGDVSARSDLRLFRTGDIIGTVINYLHPKDTAYAFSGRYLCSPSILVTSSGRLLVSMDVYGPSMAQNLSFVMKSDDGGETWQYISDLFPLFWGKLFEHQGKIFMIGMSAEYGDLIIGYSTDDGEHFTKPVSLFPGSGNRCDKGMHQAPTPVIISNGRVWTAVEYGTWAMPDGHANALVSAPADCDLLDPANWSLTELLPFDRSWPGAVPDCRWGCHEGNAVEGPDGQVYNFLRYQISNVYPDGNPLPVPSHGLAMILKADVQDPDKQLTLSRFVNFNGGMSKFSLRRDPVTGVYVALVNRVVDDTFPGQRNILSLSVSYDLDNWTIVKDLVDASEYGAEEVGFQYVDFVFDGDDIIYASRTAFNHANTFHDSNYITFHREKDFRALLPKP